MISTPGQGSGQISKGIVLIHRLTVDGLLSFGDGGIDLPLEPLNVLIGPNSAGKSNLLEILALLQQAPKDMFLPTRSSGGAQEWLWKGIGGKGQATITTVVESSRQTPRLHHMVRLAESRHQLIVVKERIQYQQQDPDAGPPSLVYWTHDKGSTLKLKGMQYRTISFDLLQTDQSILSQVRDPGAYPALTDLSQQYEEIRLYRNWSIGPAAAMRRPSSANARPDYLRENGDNAALLFSNFPPRTQNTIVKALQEVYDNIGNITTSTLDGQVTLWVEEDMGREVSAARLSDGTLRYLSLLMILLHPTPPGLIAIEEPELGLHPDIVSKVAELLVDASQRTQLLVTTHSPILLDALSAHPASVLVCTRERAGSQIERLDVDYVAPLLENAELGELWNLGELGGTRW